MMMQRFWPSFLPGWLCRPIATLCCMAVPVTAASIVYPEGLIFRYAILWNIFLAGLPLAFACLLELAAHLKWKWFWRMPLWLLWIGFFPNAAYMLTDFIHLNRHAYWYNGVFTTDVGKWFALLHLMMAIAVGCGLGMLSLAMLHRQTAKKSRTLGWVFAAGASLLSGAGIWIGRCMRFNTWDLWQRPLHLLRDIAEQFNARTAQLCLVFAAMSFGAYLLVHCLLPREEDTC